MHDVGHEGLAGSEVVQVDDGLPGNDGEDRDIECEIEGGDEGDGEEDRSGDDAGGVGDFASEEGDVVVAPEVVGGDEHGGGEAGEEGGG